MANERVPGNRTYAVVALWLTCVSALAFLLTAATAVRILAGSFVILGLLAHSRRQGRFPPCAAAYLT